MADEAFHEIQLSGKHLVALFMAATIVAVVVFLCGVMVGRGVRAQRVAEAAELAADAPLDPTASAQPSAEPDPVSATPTEGKDAANDALSYPDRLNNNDPAPETISPRPTAPAVEDAPAPAPRREVPPRETAAGTAPGPAEPAGDGFAVQVAAVKERGEAETIARRLKSRGYAAYVMAPANGAPRVFRVRVGKFRERREAEQVANRLKKDEQFKPWITR